MYRAAKDRYRQLARAARESCERELASGLGLFTLSECGERALVAIEAQWEPAGRNEETRWDWREILRRHRNDPDKLDMAIWSGEQLAGVALSLASGDSVTLAFLEGDPRPECTLKGRRALIALDASARYAQGRGKTEIRISPINASLECLYVEQYGFQKRSRRGEQDHLFRLV